MTPAISLTDRLDSLAERLKIQTARLELHARTAYEEAVATGRILGEAKATIEILRAAGHGVTWAAWLDENCGYHKSHAARLIRLADFAGALSTSHVRREELSFRGAERAIKQLLGGHEITADMGPPRPLEGTDYTAWDDPFEGEDAEAMGHAGPAAPDSPSTAEAAGLIFRAMLPMRAINTPKGMRSFLHRVIAATWVIEPGLLGDGGDPPSLREISIAWRLSHNALSKLAKEFSQQLGIRGPLQR